MAGFGTYEYEKTLSDLGSQNTQDSAASQYARFISQQRFQRNNTDANQAFQRSQPGWGAAWSRRGVGSGVKSGIMNSSLQDRFGDYQTQLGRLAEDQAGTETNMTLTDTNRQAAYQRAKMLAYEQYNASRLGADPFAAYVGMP